MKIGIEEFRRRLTEFLDTNVYVEVERRGKVVMVVMPLSQYEPTGSKLQPTGSGLKSDLNLQVHAMNSTVHSESLTNQVVTCDKCKVISVGLFVHWEDGAEYRVCFGCKVAKRAVGAK